MENDKLDSDEDVLFGQDDETKTEDSAQSEENPLQKRVDELEEKVRYMDQPEISLFRAGTDKHGNPLLGVEFKFSEVYSQGYLKKVLQDEETGGEQ